MEYTNTLQPEMRETSRQMKVTLIKIIKHSHQSTLHFIMLHLRFMYTMYVAE